MEGMRKPQQVIAVLPADCEGWLVRNLIAWVLWIEVADFEDEEG